MTGDLSDPATLAEDRRLAILHLRLGNLQLARAELEDLDRRGHLDAAAKADLADVRWRTGDLETAASAATAHLEAGGSRRIALVIAAEAAAAAGRPLESRAHVEALGAVDAETLDRVFAGMPRRAFWPSAPSSPIGPPETLFGADRTHYTGPDRRQDAELSLRRGPGGLERRNQGRHRRDVDEPVRRRRGGASDSPVGGGPSAPGGPVAAGLWGDDPEPSSRLGGRRPAGVPADALEELDRARTELASGNAGAAQRGLGRLALVLRLDATLAPDIVEALGPRRDALSLTIQGDCYRLLGRHLDAEAAFAAAADALDGADAGA